MQAEGAKLVERPAGNSWSCGDSRSVMDGTHSEDWNERLVDRCHLSTVSKVLVYLDGTCTTVTAARRGTLLWRSNVRFTGGG